MKVVLATLADFALAHEDGKLYITGGGIEALRFGVFPTNAIHLALAVALKFSEQECGQQQLVRVIPTGPGALAQHPLAIPVLPIQRPGESGATFQFVYNMRELTFSAPGIYEFRIVGGNEELAVIPLSVQQISTPAPTQVSPVSGMIEFAGGLEAFTTGDLVRAEQLFRQFTAIQPASALGRNNLGFVLLAEQRAAEALEELQRARDLGLGNPELTEANIACCEYLLGRYLEALTGFEKCFAEFSTNTRVILFGIRAERLFLVHPATPGEYIGLMALNVAWSALRMGDREKSLGMLLVCDSTNGASPHPDHGITDSANELRGLLQGPR
jgi:tetratricopeptide (TPR) repeat protein